MTVVEIRRAYAGRQCLRGAVTFAVLMWVNIGLHVYVWLHGGVS